MTNDREVVLGFECGYTFNYCCLCYFRVSIAIRRNSFRLQVAPLTSLRILEVRMNKLFCYVGLIGLLSCWIPAIVCKATNFNMVNP